jgi:lysophospholipase L1-like esterase
MKVVAAFIPILALSAYALGPLVNSDSEDPGPATGPAVPRIMLVGDSFWERDEMRQMIHDRLDAAGVEFDFVGSRSSAVTDPENEGLASKQFIHVLKGRSTPASRVSAPIAKLLPVYQPDIVALQIGTNDLWYNFQDSGGTEFHENVGRSPEQMIADLRLVARAIHAHDPATRIIVTTVTPITVPNPHIGELAGDFNALAADYNSRLRTVVPEMRSQGIHISLSDGYQAWGGDATGKVSDGLHPNTAGNRLLAGSWAAAISEALVVSDGADH